MPRAFDWDQRLGSASRQTWVCPSQACGTNPRVSQNGTLLTPTLRVTTGALLAIFRRAWAILSSYPGPSKSRTDIKTPHPQGIRVNGVDRDPADGSQHAFRVRGEQGFTGSIEAHRARRLIARESI